jgi:putative DNA primase/helicase
VDAPLGEWAQWYASQGWLVFPCRGKVPLTATGFQAATDDPFQIALWWREHPTANIGSPAGLAWWVLDVDPRHGGDDSLFALQRVHGPLPATVTSHTGGGGLHYYWLVPPDGMRNKAATGTGIDVQGRGSYVILPPSVHPETGRPYVWDAVDSPDQQEMVRAPRWLEELVSRDSGPESAKVLATPGQPIVEGSRDKTLTSLAGSARRAGFEEAAIRALLEGENTRCVPPMASADLDRIARSVCRYAPPERLIVGERPGGHQPPNAQGHASNGSAWAEPSPRVPLPIIDLADMLERQYPLPQWLIKGLIPEGLTFFVGSPKSSKTYLAYSLALSLAYEAQRGGRWLDQYEVLMPGPVVYITLEDDEADSRLRIAELAPWLHTIERERMLFIHGFDLPRLGEGLIEALTADVVLPYHPSMIVLDPISYLYAPVKKGGDQFSEVREMLLPLRWLGKEHHCAILGIDHRRKKSAEDVDIFETTYGSNAKLAIADSLLMIVREDKEITVHARVRKGGDQTLTLAFEFAEDGTAQWTWKGSTDGITEQGMYGELRIKVYDALSSCQLPMSLSDLAMALDYADTREVKERIRQVLFRGIKSKEVTKTSRGLYLWAGGRVD